MGVAKISGYRLDSSLNLNSDFEKDEVCFGDFDYLHSYCNLPSCGFWIRLQLEGIVLRPR